ncbi:MAG TPA: hypothetical protein VLE46_12205 [Nitrospira sp.]|nr:hypothetical protein [Nitrospira sp.]
MLTGEILDAVGGLTAHIKSYAAKLPPIVHLSALPSGIKPSFETVESYEAIVSRVRSQSTGTPYKALNESLVSSLEAFEMGNLLGTVQPLLSTLDHLERMQRDQEIEMGQTDEKRVKEYRAALHKVLPGNKPELDGPRQGI